MAPGADGGGGGGGGGATRESDICFVVKEGDTPRTLPPSEFSSDIPSIPGVLLGIPDRRPRFFEPVLSLLFGRPSRVYGYRDENRWSGLQVGRPNKSEGP